MAAILVDRNIPSEFEITIAWLSIKARTRVFVREWRKERQHEEIWSLEQTIIQTVKTLRHGTTALPFSTVRRKHKQREGKFTHFWYRLHRVVPPKQVREILNQCLLERTLFFPLELWLLSTSLQLWLLSTCFRPFSALPGKRFKKNIRWMVHWSSVLEHQPTINQSRKYKLQPALQIRFPRSGLAENSKLLNQRIVLQGNCEK